MVKSERAMTKEVLLEVAERGGRIMSPRRNSQIGEDPEVIHSAYETARRRGFLCVTNITGDLYELTEKGHLQIDDYHAPRKAWVRRHQGTCILIFTAFIAVSTIVTATVSVLNWMQG